MLKSELLILYEEEGEAGSSRQLACLLCPGNSHTPVMMLSPGCFDITMAEVSSSNRELLAHNA